MDRIIQMIIKQVLRHVIRRGVDTGMNHLSRRNKAAPGVTPLQNAATPSQSDRDIARKARQAANLARRLGR